MPSPGKKAALFLGRKSTGKALKFVRNRLFTQWLEILSHWTWTLDIATFDDLTAYVNGVSARKRKPGYCMMTVNSRLIRLQTVEPP